MQIGRVELVDRRSVEAVNRYKKTRHPEAPTLFFEFSGDAAGVARDVEKARKLCDKEDCSTFDFEEDEAGRRSSRGGTSRGCPRGRQPLSR